MNVAVVIVSVIGIIVCMAVVFVIALLMNGQNFDDDDDAEQEKYLREYAERKRQKELKKQLKSEDHNVGCL
jgi:mannitol-specific phosphotransferase system IIBC component